ncbi:MAG: hypothetical protein OCD76_15505 [Reichenbachiella sp.]
MKTLQRENIFLPVSIIGLKNAELGRNVLLRATIQFWIYADQGSVNYSDSVSMLEINANESHQLNYQWNLSGDGVCLIRFTDQGKTREQYVGYFSNGFKVDLLEIVIKSDSISIEEKTDSYNK